MVDPRQLLGGLLMRLLRSRAACEAEIIFLRQRLLVLNRSTPARSRLRNRDRLIFVWLYRLFPSLLDAAVILVRQISRENPLWGAPRIHGELLKLGISAGAQS